ncbi:MAG: hypothetical protein SGBAC_002785 [Bacillariaceae sp.]
MITRWHGLKTSSLLLFTTILYGCSSYLHEPKFNSQRFTLEDMLPPLAPLVPFSKGESRRYSNRWDSNHCASIPVVYTNDPETISLWLSENVPGGQFGIIGFDTESLPRYYGSYRRKKSNFENAATLQLATSSSCLVVHLVRDKYGVPSSDCAELLQRIIIDPQYIKAGCAIDEDLMDLHRLWGGLDAKSRLDLGSMRCDDSNRVGLRALAARKLGVDLPKSRRVTLSDWTKVPLTKKQIAYSARDAWAGAAIAQQLAKDDPGVFNPESLMESLHFEAPISELVERKQRRDEAKQELQQLLKRYRQDRQRHLPKHVKQEVSRLRCIIKDRVVESTCWMDNHDDVNGSDAR